MPILVDGQTYQYRGLIYATKGSGDSTERLDFTAYTGPDGRECWLGKDKEQWFLYRAPAEPSSSPKMSKLKDYRKAPVDRDGFRSLLYRTCDITKQGLAPAVRAFTPLAPSFLRWREQTVALQDVEVESLDDDVRQALEADLATISEDFEELVVYLDGLPNDCGELKTLRYSPQLVTWNY